MRTVTIDTNLVAARELIQEARAAGLNVAIVSTSGRELEASDIRTSDVDVILELAVFNESRFGQAVLASDADAENFEAALRIISGGSFPRRGHRDKLSRGERHQLRDAQIIATHASTGRDVFITDDRRGFFCHGRQQELEQRLGIRILTSAEFRTLLAAR